MWDDSDPVVLLKEVFSAQVNTKLVDNTFGIDWHSIDTVLLDMDGTLLDLHFDNYFWMRHLPKAYAEQLEIPHEDAHKDLMERFDEIRGTLQWYCLDHWGQQLSVDIMELKHEVQHLIQPRPGAMEFLDWLGQRGKRRVLVTNAHEDSIRIKTNNTDLRAGLDRIISSHEIGHPKEDQPFWHALMDMEPFDRQRTVFIDDTASVLAAAEIYGIRHVLGILMPDSKGESRHGEHPFPMIEDFAHLISGPAGGVPDD